MSRPAPQIIFLLSVPATYPSANLFPHRGSSVASCPRLAPRRWWPRRWRVWRTCVSAPCCSRAAGQRGSSCAGTWHKVRDPCVTTSIHSVTCTSVSYFWQLCGELFICRWMVFRVTASGASGRPAHLKQRVAWVITCRRFHRRSLYTCQFTRPKVYIRTLHGWCCSTRSACQ